MYMAGWFPKLPRFNPPDFHRYRIYGDIQSNAFQHPLHSNPRKSVTDLPLMLHRDRIEIHNRFGIPVIVIADLEITLRRIERRRVEPMRSSTVDAHT